jgi:phage gpG-like protein
MSDGFDIRLKNKQLVIDRLKVMRERMSPDNPAVKASLTRAALLIINQAKIEIRRKRMVDTGRLLNSLKFEFYRPDTGGIGVELGSFGVPYAALHEFGGRFTPAMRRAMFADLRERGRLRKNSKGKGVIQGGRFQARPFLRPAYAKHKDKVTELLQEVIEKGL